MPGYKYQFSFVAFALASLLTMIWLVVVARSLRSNSRAIVNWTSGITMVWMLMMTLGLQVVDQARSYRGLAARIVAQVPPADEVHRAQATSATRSARSSTTSRAFAPCARTIPRRRIATRCSCRRRR